MSSIWMMDKSGIQPLILLQVLSIGYGFASTRTPPFSCRWSWNASILQLQHMETIGPRFIFLIWCESQTYCDFGYPNWSKHQLYEWYTSSFPTNTWFNQFIWGQRMPETKFWSGTITFVNWILVTECTAFHFLIIIWLIVGSTSVIWANGFYQWYFLLQKPLESSRHPMDSSAANRLQQNW